MLAAPSRAESKATRGARALMRATPAPAPAWWAPGPHLPTIFASTLRKMPMPPTTRVQWRTPDGDTLTIERIRGRLDAPRIVVFHGLEGGTRSAYARRLLHAARQRGWWADLVLWRTCDGRAVNDVARAYHSGVSDDAGFALERIHAEDPERPTMLHGTSLGGNVLLKWLGECGPSVPRSIKAAAAVSVPFDLAAASRRIEQGASAIYGIHFLRSLKRKAIAKAARFPGLCDSARVARARTLREFDDAFTAPIHGFASAEDYYEQSSSIRYLARIRTPTLLLSARNDPLLPAGVVDEVRSLTRENPVIECVFPEAGGHVGFFGGTVPGRPQYWSESFAMDWLEIFTE